MSKLKSAELFAGSGALSLAVNYFFDSETQWISEFDKYASHLLDVRLGKPNIGDISKTDFSTLAKVDIIAGGSPCQDVSLSGQRKGMVEGTRSNLWVSMVECINEIKPSLVVWENVRGALSAKAYSRVEQSEGRMGKNLTALGRVLGDLSDIGYDAQWRIVRASDIGAPHQRERVFVLAWKRNSDPSSFRWDSWRKESLHIPQFGSDLKRLGSSGFYGASSDTFGIESFGEYQGRVRHWEDVTGVLAPIPSRLPNKGRYNISPKFSEWMMGLPQGWVTGDDLGLSNRQQLKIIGNAVVPLQALLALQELSVGMEESIRSGM